MAKVRSQKKALVTRQLGTIERLMVEEEIELVKEKLERVKGTFNELEAAHDAYHDALEDETEITTSERWFEQVQLTYISRIKIAKAWLNSQVKEAKVQTVQQEIKPGDESLMKHFADMMFIPKIEIESFDGSPLEYQAFIAVFDEMVDSKVNDNQVKLTRLLQYTTGPAKAAIKNCALVGGEAGYKQARDILQHRYGNVHLVSQCIIANLKKGKNITRAPDLQQFSDDLCMALTALEKLGMYNEINTQQSIIDILMRCQSYIQSRWRKKALEMKAKHDSYPNFREFVEFIKVIATEACDPVYGTPQAKSHMKGASCNVVCDQPSQQSSYQYYTGSQQTSQESQRRPNLLNENCVVCRENHRLFYCDRFKAMSPRARLDVVVRNRLCFNCLLRGHGYRTCHKRSVCSVPGCNKKHTKFIHVEDNVTTEHNSSLRDSQGTQAQGGEVSSGNVNVNTVCSSVYLPIVPVVVNGNKEVYALLDTGSTNSFISRSLAAQLRLVGEEVNFKMNTMGNSSNVNSQVVSVCLQSVNGENVLKIDNVFIVPNIPAKYPSHQLDIQKYPYLSGVPIKKGLDIAKVDLLIGMDNAHALMPLELRCSPDGSNKPYAVRTVFGWSLNGPVHKQIKNEVDSNLVDIEQQMKSLWNMETLDEDIQSLSYEDKFVLNMWKDEIILKDGHYVIPIPWRNGAPNFPENKFLATSRLRGLLNRLNRIKMFDTYNGTINRLITDGYAELVPRTEIGTSGSSVWYIPHHGVVSESKPGKIRPVFDCAAKVNNVSLNSQCFQGPDLNNKLVHVLLRFRQYEYAISADIEAMYLQVKIPPKDRDSLRFLWVNEDNSSCFTEYRMTSHLFGGVWCAASSTFALRRTLEETHPNELIKSTVQNSFYVDDLLKSVKTKEEAIEVIFGTKEILKSGGFNLTKFITNSTDIQQMIDVEDRANEMKLLTSEVQSKALGVKWDVTQDSFFYRSTCKHTGMEEEITKRKMLSQLASIYDPLGLISPIIMKGKILFQKATSLNRTWDEIVPVEMSRKWIHWINSLQDIDQIKIPRCIIPPEFIDNILELHHFCDASESGFGACSYLRIGNRWGKVHVTLLLCKGKVAPLKKITIPRLELSAAVVAVKLDCIIKRELDVKILKTYYWTDSQITLAYIRSNSRRFKLFVANRVSQIREHSSPDEWNYIRGEDNPADILSRGSEVKELVAKWFKGPEFLKQHKHSWKVTPQDNTCLLENDPEVKQHSDGQMNINVVSAGRPHPIDTLTNYYSSYYRLTKAICWILRLKFHLLHKEGIPYQQPNVNITVPEMKRAQKYILQYVQTLMYPDEISAIRQNKMVGKSSSIQKLSPMLENGILVVGGRLKHAALAYSIKHPAILPQNHKVSQLIVEEFHNAAHLGTEWTLSQIRRKYWIVKARKLVKFVKRCCVTCKKLYGKPMEQKMADLPPDRCVPGLPPFTCVGVDLFGPFLVKVGRSEAKRYGCLYTCFTTRAIHIETLHSLETDTFINGFVRFASRRGYPEKVWSDNGTNLVGARTELSKSLRQLDRNKIIQNARRQEVEWSFNPPLASHQGGIWERMIRTVRRVLTALINSSNRMTDDILNTVMCEVESIVNSRPITKASEDVNDDVPLTPNHLLLLKENVPLPWGVFHDTDVYRKHWRQVQHISTQFWRRWIREYLPELQARQKWLKEKPNLKIGNLVLIMDENIARGSWPLGLVVDLSVGRDGLVRSAKINTKSTTLVRPITKLVLLEGA